MKFPDEEAMRKLKEIQQAMPSAAEKQMMKELSRTLTQAEKQAMRAMEELARPSRNAIQQAALAAEAIGRAALKEHYRIAEQMRDIANVIGPNIRQQMAELAASIAVPIHDSYQIASARIAFDLTKTFREHQSNAIAEAIQHIQALTRASDAPIRLALETMRSINFEIANPAFTDFMEDALEQPEPLTKKKVETLTKSHLSKKKIARLSKEQQFNLTTALAILSLLVSIYSALKAGQPIKIDPSQLAQLNQPQIKITNIWQIISGPDRPVYYRVERKCELIPKPNSKAMIIYRLSHGDKVRLLLMNHKWIFVKYEEGNLNKEGWVQKKYLKRQD
jgi:hypothetical protein